MKKTAWLLLLKIALTLISLWVIYKQVIEKENLADVIRDARHLANDNNAVFLLTLSLFLMLINWSIEAYKWKFLISKIVSITFLQSVNAVLSGVTLSFFMPNRVGEFAGRVLHLPAGTRIKATFATIIGNTAQFIITFLTGSIAAGFIMQFFEVETPLKLLIEGSIIFINLLLMFVYFNISYVDKWLMKFKFMRKYESHIHAFSVYSKAELLKVLALSFIRYLVFATQFVLILKMMNIEGYWGDLFIAVAVVFLAITIIPSIALTEIAIRGSVAVALIGLVSGNNLGILEASFIVWFMNLVIPSVIGSFTLLSLKLARQK